MEDRFKPKDWGEGIPDYSKKDLMTAEEIFDMGIETIRNFLKKDGFIIKMEMPESDSIINFLAKKDEKVYAINIKTDIAPNIPTISEKETKQLFDQAKEKNAIPLFASVGFGSADGERFDAGLALKGDGYYCRFTGFEEINDLKCFDKTDNKEKSVKMNESLINKIAEVYMFDNTSDFGFYNSYRNFCLKNIVRLDFVYGSKNVRVNSTPVEYTLSDTKSSEIKMLFNKYYSKLSKIDKSETDDVKKYFLIEYVDGNKEYYNYNDEFNEIFNCDESDGINNKPEVISTPYLVFEDSSETNKYRVINDFGVCIKNKDFSNIYKYLSNECLITINQLRVSGIDNIKREVKNRSGFLNSKLKKIKFYTNVMGYLKNNKSEVCLKVELTDEHYKTTKYALYFEFDKNNNIDKVEIELLDEKTPMKTIFDDGLNNLLKAKYNDYKN